ncbi:hypothetical protein CONLIGDRAFT_416898 [Coniochaeta ligniaria NRRL 30616]|uniref:Uncharacterized protein n=1 Tax=Coniochaeta ligniaria NRRL 30616 TaxID=1408157 RepID=A0A1J7IHH8_9PEZI|nr:hypothetical protein CONLIGDRAFT_416898 [Coniochaeta ligniaria NRRL 30616]
MAPRREILDSDEEDDDFSPVKDAVAPPLLDQDIGHESDSLETPRNRRAESTDPSFFRNVYDDHNVAANAQQSTSSIAALSSELVSTLSPNPPLNLGHFNEHDPSHLSSITDPVPASRRRHKQSEMKEVVDLTQVTTPGRPTPSVPTDIWDFPASPDADASAVSSSVNQTASTKKKITIKLKKAETKRKSGLSSSIQSPEEISSRLEHPSSVLLPALSVTQAEQTSDAVSPGPRHKRRRISSSGQRAPNSQEVDLLIIPQSEDKLASGNNYVTPTGNPSSIVEDSLKPRSTSLMVVPITTLTASQKDEYTFVSLSSEADRSHEHLGLTNAFGQAEDLHKSSGSATIKYPTPIEYVSSGRREPHPGDYGTASSSRPKRRRNVVNSDPVSYLVFFTRSNY